MLFLEVVFCMVCVTSNCTFVNGIVPFSVEIVFFDTDGFELGVTHLIPFLYHQSQRSRVRSSNQHRSVGKDRACRSCGGASTRLSISNECPHYMQFLENFKVGGSQVAVTGSVKV